MSFTTWDWFIFRRKNVFFAPLWTQTWTKWMDNCECAWMRRKYRRNMSNRGVDVYRFFSRLIRGKPGNYMHENTLHGRVFLLPLPSHLIINHSRTKLQISGCQLAPLSSSIIRSLSRLLISLFWSAQISSIWAGHICSSWTQGRLKICSHVHASSLIHPSSILFPY